MKVSDIMTTNVVSVPSNTSLIDAKRIMEAHHIRRLPVIDHGALAGIVSKSALDKVGPSQLTTFSIHEISYLIQKITVKEVMHRDVVTINQDMTVEEAVALAQSKKVGALVVVESGHVVGICTTNDFFYRILNPILGIGVPGCRIVVRNCNNGRDIEKIIAVINSLNIGIKNLFIIDLPEAEKHDLVVHLNTPEDSSAIATIEKLGWTVEKRER